MTDSASHLIRSLTNYINYLYWKKVVKLANSLTSNATASLFYLLAWLNPETFAILHMRNESWKNVKWTINSMNWFEIFYIANVTHLPAKSKLFTTSAVCVLGYERVCVSMFDCISGIQLCV